jgi:osmotically inducible lipoprotein OsmB
MRWLSVRWKTFAERGWIASSHGFGGTRLVRRRSVCQRTDRARIRDYKCKSNRFPVRLPQESFVTHRLITLSTIGLLALFLGACSGMSTRDKNTATGAAIGGVAGAVLTGGSTAGTVGGAAVGGVIGNQVDPQKK